MSGKIQHGPHLLASEPVEHTNDLVHRQPIFKIFETAATGIRVPRNTQAPLTLPGMLSTASHCDQSSICGLCYFNAAVSGKAQKSFKVIPPRSSALRG